MSRDSQAVLLSEGDVGLRAGFEKALQEKFKEGVHTALNGKVVIASDEHVPSARAARVQHRREGELVNYVVQAKQKHE